MALTKLLLLMEDLFRSFHLKNIGSSFFDQTIYIDLMIQFKGTLPYHENIYPASNDSMSVFFREICSFLLDSLTKNSFYLLHSICYKKNSFFFYFYQTLIFCIFMFTLLHINHLSFNAIVSAPFKLNFLIYHVLNILQKYGLLNWQMISLLCN